MSLRIIQNKIIEFLSSQDEKNTITENNSVKFKLTYQSIKVRSYSWEFGVGFTLSDKKTKFERQNLKGGEDRTYTTICGATCDKNCHSIICTGATRNFDCK